MTNTITTLKSLRQHRNFDGTTIGPGDLDQILEVARWTGSSRNSQPWQLIVVDDREQLKLLANVRESNNWMENASVAIAIVMPSEETPAHNYDEGRLTERIMIAASALGFGAGVAWFIKDEEKAAAQEILGVPAGSTVRGTVVIGKIEAGSGTSGKSSGGRKPLTEIVSYNTFGNREKA